MLKEHDTVVLLRDLPASGLAAGDLGAIVHLYPDGKALEVEFVGLAGDTISVETLPIEAVRAVQAREIAHVRAVA